MKSLSRVFKEYLGIKIIRLVFQVNCAQIVWAKPQKREMKGKDPTPKLKPEKTLLRRKVPLITQGYNSMG